MGDVRLERPSDHQLVLFENILQVAIFRGGMQRNRGLGSFI